MSVCHVMLEGSTILCRLKSLLSKSRILAVLLRLAKKQPNIQASIAETPPAKRNLVCLNKQQATVLLLLPYA